MIRWKKGLAVAAIAAVAILPALAKNNTELSRRSDDFFKTEEAQRIAKQVIAYQRITGGWPKNIDMAEPMTEEQWAKAKADFSRTDDSTTDNAATNTQMVYLARLWREQGGDDYKASFMKGVEYLLSGQYANGGWPQFWPNPQGYQIHITFNDGAMVNTMNLLHRIAQHEAPFDKGLVSGELAQRCAEAYDKGVRCILDCQIVVDGKPTVWCQQHDRETYEPRGARKYELPSFVSLESVQIVGLLMSLPEPDERVKAAVHGAMRWLDDHKLTGIRCVRDFDKDNESKNTYLKEDPEAGALWGRFYDLENQEIYVCDRDGIPRRDLQEIGPERRNGYGWYNSLPAMLYPMYDEWADKYDPDNKQKIDMESAAKCSPRH